MISVARATTKRERFSLSYIYVCIYISALSSSKARAFAVRVFLLLLKRVVCVSKFNNNTLLTSLFSLFSLSTAAAAGTEEERERERVLWCRFTKARRRFKARSSFAAFEACDASLCVCSLGFNIQFRV
jgi:hypothetical protein